MMRTVLLALIVFVAVGFADMDPNDRKIVADMRAAAPDLLGASSKLVGWDKPYNEADPTTNPCFYQGITCTEEPTEYLEQLDLRNIATQTTPLRLPQSLWTLGNVGKLLLSGNFISGPIPEQISQLGRSKSIVTTIDLSHNQFSSVIPPEIGQIPGFENLDLSHNVLTGSIPAKIFKDTMWILNLEHNQLSGELPATFTQATQLYSLDLSDNLGLSGNLPSNLYELSQLSFIDIANTGFEGSIPNLPDTHVVSEAYFNNTGLRGPMPRWFTSFTGILSLENAGPFQCPIPDCADGIDCAYKDLIDTLTAACTCSCASPEYCVEFTEECVCPSYKWGTQCQRDCPGIFQDADGLSHACSGNGDCDFGYQGTGVCTCFSGYRGLDCELACPGGANNTCNGVGVCDDEAKCECFEDYGGAACQNCKPGYADLECKTVCPGFDGSDTETICSGEGQCVRETGKCECNVGREGERCDLLIDESAIVALAIVAALVFILFIVAVIFVVLGCLRYKKKKQDYDNLLEDIEEEEAIKAAEEESSAEEEEERTAVRKSQVIDMSL